MVVVDGIILKFFSINDRFYNGDGVSDYMLGFRVWVMCIISINIF